MNELDFNQLPLENKFNILLSYSKTLLSEIEKLKEENRQLKKAGIKLESGFRKTFLFNYTEYCQLLHDIKTLEKKELQLKYKTFLLDWKAKHN